MPASRLVKWCAGGFTVLLILSCAGFVFPLQATFYIGFGWVRFLARVAPQLTINWSGVTSGMMWLTSATIGGHLFLRWVYANTPKPGNLSGPPRHWHRRWTLCLMASVVLAFASGICVVGMTHQAAWLITSKDSLVELYSVREATSRSQSNNNLKQIALGVMTYDDRNQMLPAGATFDRHGRPQHSWQTTILPFVEQKPLYDSIERSIPWNARENRLAFSVHVPTYMHPKMRLKADDRGYALSGYAANTYLLGGEQCWLTDAIADGTSKTILCGEATTRPRPWGDPVNWRDPALGIRHTPDGFGGPFENVTQFVFVDGHATSISNKIDPAVLRALCTPAAGDTIPSGIDD